MSSLRRSLPCQTEPTPAVEAPAPAPVVDEPVASTGEFQAQFDSEGHILVGNSVQGQGVEIHGVLLSPGELAALVDYVGDLNVLTTAEFSRADILAMQARLAEDCEDAAVWDRLTHGRYSKLAFANEDHFAPGAGSADHGSSFVGAYAAAFFLAQKAGEVDEGSPQHADLMSRARLQLYRSEHYLQDSFSSGHQVSAGDVAAAVDALLAETDLSTLFPDIAADIVAREPEVLSRYSLRGLNSPIDSWTEMVPIVAGARIVKQQEGIKDSARLALHRRLEEIGVEVSSPAHPTPWVLSGDQDPQQNAETMSALGAALTEARDLVEVGAMPGMDPTDVATRLFERHCPQPTGNGRAVVDNALKEGTSSRLGLAMALSDAACDQIEAIMDEAVAAWIVVELDAEEAPAQEAPAKTPYVEFPDTRPSYVPGF